MKNYLKKVSPYVIVIVILIVALIFSRECRRCPDCPEQTTTVINHTDTIRDTTLITKIIYKPLPKETIFIDIPVDANVEDIVNDYYTMKYYENIYLDDTSAYIATKDTVFNNALYSSELVFVNRRPTVINNTTTIITYDTCKECKHWNIGIGGLIGGYTDKFGAGPSVIVSTNKKMSYTASYDFVQKIGYFGIYFNVR